MNEIRNNNWRAPEKKVFCNCFLNVTINCGVEKNFRPLFVKIKIVFHVRDTETLRRDEKSTEETGRELSTRVS